MPAGASIIGLDLSLRATGIAVVPVRWGLDWSRVRVSIVGRELSAGATERERYLRIDDIAMQVIDQAERNHCKVAAIEQHAFRKGGGAMALERAELVGVVKRVLFQAGINVVAYNASAARSPLGTAPRKDPKVWAHQRLYAAGAPKAWGGDQLDAFLQANHHLSLTNGDAVMLPAEVA